MGTGGVGLGRHDSTLGSVTNRGTVMKSVACPYVLGVAVMEGWAWGAALMPTLRNSDRSGWINSTSNTQST